MITGDEPINYQTDWGNQGEKMTGLTIRQHFAAMAMQGILSNPTFTDNAKKIALDKGIQITDDAIELIQPFSKLAVDCADILIQELNKPTNG